jgi:hypothetical protein
VWNVGAALRAGRTLLSELSFPLTHSGSCRLALPDVYMSVALSAVKTISVGRFPPGDSAGDPLYSEDPVLLFFGCYDGTGCCIDVRDTQTAMIFQHSRSQLDSSCRTESS